MKTFSFLGFLLVLLLAGPAVRAQAPAAKEAPTASAILITDKMEVPAVRAEALKLRVDQNPVTNTITVRTDANGPTRIEVNGTDGRPVITRDVLLAGESAVVLSVANLPRGAYIIKCVAGERRGIKRVILN